MPFGIDLPDPGIEAPDWLTTGREKLQSGIGTAAGAIKGPASTALGYAFDPRKAPELQIPLALGRGVWGMTPWSGDGGGGGGGGGGSTDQNKPAATTPAASTAKDTTYSPYVNPLVMSAFFSNTIAPYLQGLAQQFGNQSQHWQNMAQQNLNRFQMPAQFKSFFGQALPQMAADQANVQASLMGAAATQPQYESMMQNLGNLQKQGQQLFALETQRKAQEALGLTGGTGITGSPGQTVAGI